MDSDTKQAAAEYLQRALVVIVHNGHNRAAGVLVGYIHAGALARAVAAAEAFLGTLTAQDEGVRLPAGMDGQDFASLESHLRHFAETLDPDERVQWDENPGLSMDPVVLGASSTAEFLAGMKAAAQNLADAYPGMMAITLTLDGQMLADCYTVEQTDPDLEEAVGPRERARAATDCPGAPSPCRAAEPGESTGGETLPILRGGDGGRQRGQQPGVPDQADMPGILWATDSDGSVEPEGDPMGGRVRDFMQNQMAKMGLRLLAKADGMGWLFEMRNKDGTSDHVTRFLFHDWGTVLTGDSLDVQTRSYLYGLEWFAGQLSAEYMAEKFGYRRSDWCAERCAAELREWFGENPAEGDGASEVAVARVDCLKWLESGDYTPHDVYLAGPGMGWQFDDGVPGYDYPPDVGWLSAFQQRFAYLYHHDDDLKAQVGVARKLNYWLDVAVSSG